MSLRNLFGFCFLTCFGVWLSLGAKGFGQAPYDYPYGGGHASTAEEGMARGLSSMIRASGEAALLNSEAAKNYEDARAKNLDNRLKATNTWFELRRINREERFGGREGPSSEQLFRINHARMPDRLSASQFDPVTGAIDWPVALRMDQFASERAAVEEGFAALRERGGAISFDDYTKLRAVLTQLETKLRPLTETIPPTQYIRASSFLRSLAFEAQLAAG